MTIREIEEKYSHPIGILGDLQGPKLRVSLIDTASHRFLFSPMYTFSDLDFFWPWFLTLAFHCKNQVGEFSNPAGEVLEAGNTFRFDLDTALGDNKRVNLPHPEIIGASEVGHTLMVDDGKVKLTVIEKGDDYLICNVDVPGKISNRKGVNTPDSILEISPLTTKDRSDLDYMLEIGVDWVALSFVQKPEDILEIRGIVDAKIPEGESKPAIMAKIEKPSCFDGDNLENLVELCDGIMVARGVSCYHCSRNFIFFLEFAIIAHERNGNFSIFV